MPTLPSLLNYRPQLKGKVGLKSPFSKRIFDSPSLGAASAPPLPQASHSQEVLDISEPKRSESLDFCDGSPSFEQQLYGENHHNRLPSPRLQLELNLTSDTEPLSDWFSTKYPRPELSPRPVRKAESNQVDSQDEYENDILEEGEVFEGSIEDIPSGDVIANLEAMNASSFGRLRPESFAPNVPAKDSPGRLKIPRRPPPPPPDEDSFTGRSSPLSSAVSGTTIARQLIGNGFSLSHDNRASRHRSTLVGLTRSDSTTLPRREFEDDHFEVDPNAPPVPFNAEALYVAPKNPREPEVAIRTEGIPRTKTIKRRSSTGTIADPEHDSALSKSPTRPSSALVSPTEFHSAFPIFPLPPSDTDPIPVIAAPSPHPERRNVPPAINLPTSAPNAPSSAELAATAGSPDVIDYYSFSDSPDQDVDILPPLAARGFRPMFTPITEESLSQLSPPAPYTKGDRRDSQRVLPLGARSPSSPGRVRSVLSPQRSASDSPSLLAAIHSRPVSNTFTASSTSLTSSGSGSKLNGSQTSINNLNEGLAPPAPLSNVFNRQRAGSAPGPIQVVRDEEDLTKYKIAGLGEAPDSGDSATTQEEQMFPETATAPWSAAFSPAIPSGAGHQPLNPSSEAVKSADPSTSAFNPPTDQQILLTRAATSARARHSRQVSLGMSRGQAQQSTSSLAVETIEEAEEPSRAQRKGSDGEIKLVPPQRHPPPLRSLPPSPGGGKRCSFETPPSLQDPEPTLSQEDTIVPPNTALIARSPSSANSVHSNDSVSASTHASQNSARPSLKSLPPIPPTPDSSSSSSSSSSAPLPASPPQATANRGPRSRMPQPLQLSEGAAIPLPIVAENPSSPSPETTELASNPPPGKEPEPQPNPLPPQSSRSHKSTNTIDEILRASTTLGSPPPYYSVVDQLQTQQAQPQPPSFAHSNPPFQNVQPIAATPSVSFTNPFSNSNNQGRDSVLPTGSRARPRPAGPLGPRRPTLQNVASPGPLQLTTRDRSGSSASLARQVSNSGASSSRLAPPRAEYPAATPKSPKFSVPPVKYRGYTMEAAKWTFTSSQLQSIVSRAIRDSAQTGAIRLLKLDNLDNDIPEEVHRLEMARTDIKHKYKALTKRRTALFESLTFHLTSSGEENSTFALRIAEELNSISLALDQLAEELHSADVELAQLNSIVQIHSSSALSMALRKLNASFLKQVAETQHLQERVSVLEAERDEGWKQAEELAREYDHLHFQEKLDSPSSKRSSRISAKRKSSIRVTKAGLRSASRRQSARSSVASSVFSGSQTPLSSKSPFKAEKIPPLPPIPRRRPADIITDYQSPLQSSGALSPEGITPNSETRAMVRAEEELYSMLGLSVPDSGVKRSRSLVGHLPSAGLSPVPMATRPALQRRSSLPGEATLIEAQNAMVADQNAVVFTFEMLRDEPDDLHSGLPYSNF